MSENVISLDYAIAQSLGGAEARRAFRLLLIVAILSGLCVGVCFLSLAAGVVGAVIHVAVFTATIIVAIKGGRAMMAVVTEDNRKIDSAQLVLDLLAAVGLVIIGIAPVVYHLCETWNVRLEDSFAAGSIALAYGLLAGTTYRHLLFHRSIAEYCRQNSHYPMAKAVSILGWVKMIYEGIWLSLCAIGLLSFALRELNNSGGLYLGENVAVLCAYGAFLGAMGFAVIWIWMIIVHANLMRLTRKN